MISRRNIFQLNAGTAGTESTFNNLIYRMTSDPHIRLSIRKIARVYLYLKLSDT